MNWGAPGWPSPTCWDGDLTIHTKRLRVSPLEVPFCVQAVEVAVKVAVYELGVAPVTISCCCPWPSDQALNTYGVPESVWGEGGSS
jgi:hypothetical protein